MVVKSFMYISVSDLISSKVFQRLKGKTQLFSPNSNDHYRNRMTHSFEVYSISLEIAKKINESIDIDMLSIMALSHDLGHTPFGHEGERTLHNILCGKDTLGGLLPKIDEQNGLQQGFKHNVYSAKLFLRSFPRYDKNDENALLIDGIIKHTKPYYEDNHGEVEKMDYGVDRIIREFAKINSIDNYAIIKEPISLEGSIVALSDEIAQRCSDLTDSLISKTILFNEFQSILGEWASLISDYKDAENSLRKLLIDGVVYDSNNKIVYLNDIANKMNDKIDKFIKDKIQSSYIIRADDDKNHYMIRQVFKAFYNNPRQMDDSTLVKIYSDIFKSHVPSIKTECLEPDDKVNIIKVARFISEACKRIKNNESAKYDIIIFRNFMANIAYYIADMTDNFLRKKYHKLYNGKDD